MLDIRDLHEMRHPQDNLSVNTTFFNSRSQLKTNLTKIPVFILAWHF